MNRQKSKVNGKPVHRRSTLLSLQAGKCYSTTLLLLTSTACKTLAKVNVIRSIVIKFSECTVRVATECIICACSCYLCLHHLQNFRSSTIQLTSTTWFANSPWTCTFLLFFKDL